MLSQSSTDEVEIDQKSIPSLDAFHNQGHFVAPLTAGFEFLRGPSSALINTSNSLPPLTI